RFAQADAFGYTFGRSNAESDGRAPPEALGLDDVRLRGRDGGAGGGVDACGTARLRHGVPAELGRRQFLRLALLSRQPAVRRASDFRANQVPRRLRVWG